MLYYILGGIGFVSSNGWCTEALQISSRVRGTLKGRDALFIPRKKVIFEPKTN